MRYYLLFLLCILSAPAAYAADGSDNIFGLSPELAKWINLKTVLFALGFILFLVIVRKLYAARNKYQRGNPPKKVVRKDDIYNPRFWYQCRNCRATVRKDSMPGTADCFQATDHLWTQLAEVGTNEYLCRRCGTAINAKFTPVSENCPDAPAHDWELLKQGSKR